jgi:hypothetical protein
VSFTVMGIIMTVSASLLSYLKDNKELQADPAYNITKNINDIIVLFTKSMENYRFIFIVSMLLFAFACNHIYLSIQKKKIQKLHITIIDEIVEEKKDEKKDEKKVTLPVEAPGQSRSAS